MRRLDHLSWPLSGFDILNRLGYPGAGKATRFPIRFLRYWFCRRALEELHSRIGRPLCVLEIGIAGGAMLAFMGGQDAEDGKYRLPEWIARWDGLDVTLQPDLLRQWPYTDLIEADVEQAFDCRRKYDAIVLLHVLEHLLEPEATMTRLCSLLRDDGALIGGSPTMPSLLAVPWEPWLRRRNGHLDVKSHRHLSVITPKRLRRFAEQARLNVRLLAGTFFCRWSGLFLEDTKAWVRANLTWGALFPFLGGEVYFCLQKTAVVDEAKQQQQLQAERP